MTRDNWIFLAGQMAGGGSVLVGLAVYLESVSLFGIGMILWFGSYLIDPCNRYSYTAKKFPK